MTLDLNTTRIRPVLVPPRLAGLMAELGSPDWSMDNSSTRFAQMFANVDNCATARGTLDPEHELLLSDGELVRITHDHRYPTHMTAWRLSQAQVFEFTKAME